MNEQQHINVHIEMLQSYVTFRNTFFFLSRAITKLVESVAKIGCLLPLNKCYGPSLKINRCLMATFLEFHPFDAFEKLNHAH